MNAANLPLWFEAGHGQAGMTAPFAAHGPDSAFFMTESNAQFVLRKASGETAATCMQFVGANPAARITGESEMPGKVNYLIGNDPAQWRSGVPAFGRVRVDDLYPGINVVYYGNGRQLEYDFDLAAGVDPRSIAIRFDGADKISVNPQGELVVTLNGGEVIQRRPVVYQENGLVRHEIKGGYQVLNAHTATFALGNYNHSLPLVIDPVLGYSTYFGGNNGDAINAIALGSDGSVYVAGQTLSTIFTNVYKGYQTNFQGGGAYGDAFVAKFDSLGTNVYFTYLGGSGSENALGVAVDQAKHAFVTGYTDSTNFPVTTNNAYQTQNGGAADAFVTELGAAGTNLLYSTLLGGKQADAGLAITVDTNDVIYVVGYTSSTNFPFTTSAYQSKMQCSNTFYYNANAFLAEIQPNAIGTNSLKYSSFFGGTNLDVATAITLDSANQIYVAGYTSSTNFPLTNALPASSYYNPTNLNGTTNNIGNFDAFVAKFTTNFTSLVYSTYLGGTNIDWALGIAVDGSGNAYVVGKTASTNFPFQSPVGHPFSSPLANSVVITSTNIVATNAVITHATNIVATSAVITNTVGYVVATNAFLTKIIWDGTKTSIGFSVVFGGVGRDVATGVALDKAGNIFVVGSASSTNFPVLAFNLSGSLRTTNSSQQYMSDAFVTAFDTNAALLYSAYLGGLGDDYGNAIAVDQATGNAYVAGSTTSTNFPAVYAWEPTPSGNSDGFLTKILLATSSMSAATSGTNLLVFWYPIGEDLLGNFKLTTTTNLISTSTNGWPVVTNYSPVLSNGVYQYTLPHTNSAQFFRMQQY